ncbi:hypothetical protein [Microbacterium atlanticum]|uniref:hypothetical protein n=1 Tax=Microbacterium atlanticum TaxID=2782168 RepID=UPI001E2FB854|nr:hypothetical protein [Microbacterium atlanticum]
MEIATSQLPRIMRLTLIGTATAFAWVVLSLVLGIGQAHAQDDEKGLLGGALGGVTAAVDTAAATVTQTVSTVTTGVVSTADTAVASAPPPVQQPVSQVVQNVGAAVAAATQPVADAASGGAVGSIAQPVVDAVKEVPVVGDLVAAVGIDEAVTTVGTTVDETLAGVVGSVSETGATIGEPPVDGVAPLPGAPELPALDLSSPAHSSAGDAAPADLDLGAAGVSPLLASASDAATVALRVAWAAASVTVAGVADVLLDSSAALGASGPSSSPGGLCLPSASAGPGGAGPGAWALVALVPLAAHRAWVRRAGPEDEHAPPAPAGSTDVSPD